ncbi:MAG: response regulator [Candidatus Schekmanbacteria bacterium]|nr:MAG: response regulator [Candidatus Schekmanbacteria bacterium]
MKETGQFEVYVEVLRAVIIAVIFLFLLWSDRKNDLKSWDGWRYILNGFFFLTFATTIDITDNYPSLSKFYIIGPTVLEAILEKIVGYLLGSILLALGFFKFVPLIADYRREAEARRKAEEFSKNILSSVDEGFIIIDENYRILSANRAFLESAGVEFTEAVGKKCYAVSHHSEKPCYESGEECAVMHTFQTGKPHNVLHKHISSDGSPYYVEIKSYPFSRENGRVKSVIEVLNDVTEKRQLEEQLAHSQKLEAVGQLAGGIAHDFNNIVTAIMGYAKLIKKKNASIEEAKKYAEQILLVAEKANSLTKSLLIFSRKGTLEVMPISVNDIILGMSELFRVVVGRKIELETDLLDEDIMIMADKGQIEQILLNLISNAKDAMPKGGKIKIKTAFAKLGETFIKVHNLEPAERYALITVSDEGEGMDDETKARIFEPFFTTKPVGKGTGLGLSMVYGIVKQHKGYIKVESKKGIGSKFYIYFPETNEMPIGMDDSTDKFFSGNGEKILLAEDDNHIRRLMENCLTDYGYKVVVASNGNEAVKVFCENDDIELAVIDYIMPEKDGLEASKEIKKINPNVKILFLSGFSDNNIEREINDEIKNAELLTKPILPERLLNKVREILSKEKELTSLDSDKLH